MNELVVIDTQGGVRRFPLTFDELTIGREPANKIVLDDPRVSRRHARVFRGEKGHYIEDLGSANGVTLEGVLIRGASLLNVGAKVEVGGFVLTIVPQGTPQTSLGRNVARLKGLNGPTAGKEFVVGDGRITIGRIDSNQVVIDDASVSRHHARIQRENDKWVLYDLGSSNGTFVGGRPTQQKELKDNEKVMFGSIAFRFTAPSSNTGAPGLAAPVVYAIAASVVLIALAIALALVLRPRVSAPQNPSIVESELAETFQLAREAMQREEWDTAMRQYDAILARDPTHAEARAKRSLASEYAIHKQALASAQQQLQSGSKVEAIKALVRIPAASVYAERAQKLMVAISDAQRAESKSMKKDLTLTKEEQGALEARYSQPQVVAAMVLYMKGDFEGALSALAKIPKGKSDTGLIAKDIRAVRVKQADGAVASQATDGVEKALKEWEEGMKTDLSLIPANVRSQPRNDLRRFMGDCLYTAGYHKFIRGDYAEAFAYWKRGTDRSPENVDIVQGFLRLETIADRFLQESERLRAAGEKVKSCEQLQRVIGLTLDTADVNAKARARILEQCK
jgi:pSer/pThr/pTyr-binding forkhead associated (FHA) protein/tetratricopeptide (TPR) repeat protein